MTKTKEKTELTTREETRPESNFWDVERYVDKLLRHPFSLLTPSFQMPEFHGLGEISPSVDIFEEGGDIVVKADLPGIAKDDLNVSITEDTLTITGEKKHEEKVEKKDFHRIERTHGSFTRSFHLPGNVKGDKAKASFRDGVLEVRLPKTKDTKEKKIAIT